MSDKIAPFLWFDTHTEEAITFYTSIFENARIIDIKRHMDWPLEGPMQEMEGRVLNAVFELAGERFMAMDGGPYFQFTPATSFFVTCGSEGQINLLWSELSEGGAALMPLQAHPFSQKFGWVEDRYGVSWQLNLGTGAQTIKPFFLFVGEQHGKAEEAINFYTSLFGDAAVLNIEHNSADDDPPTGTVKRALFQVHGREFMVMDSHLAHDFGFSPAISIYVDCDSQQEIDHLWHGLSAVPEAEQCGWLSDRYGVTWQIVPRVLPEMLSDPDPDKASRVMQAMLEMKKMDIAALERARNG